MRRYRLPGVGYVRSGAQRYEDESAQGSLLTSRDTANAVMGRNEYDAFGREVVATGTDRGDFRFGGKHGYVNDDATGMQLLGARYYIPVLGRFLTQDPIGHEGGLNLYAYCGDSPLLRVDPSGTQLQGVLSLGGPITGPSWQDFTRAWDRFQAFRAAFNRHPSVSAFDYWLNRALSTPGVGVPYGGALVGAVESPIWLRTARGMSVGKYTIDGPGMIKHMLGTLRNGESQFLYRVNAEEVVMKAAHYADEHNLWNAEGKAKVMFNAPIGVLGGTGELTNTVNVYRTARGMIHGAPGSPR